MMFPQPFQIARGQSDTAANRNPIDAEQHGKVASQIRYCAGRCINQGVDPFGPRLGFDENSARVHLRVSQSARRICNGPTACDAFDSSKPAAAARSRFSYTGCKAKMTSQAVRALVKLTIQD